MKRFYTRVQLRIVPWNSAQVDLSHLLSLEIVLFRLVLSSFAPFHGCSLPAY